MVIFPQSEYEALFALFNATGGTNWLWVDYIGWNVGIPWNFTTKPQLAVSNPCLDSWQGVVCNTDNNTVVKLYLFAHNLVGRIPKALTALNNLTRLEVGENLLTGPFPSFLLNMEKLTTFYAYLNALTGKLPQQIDNVNIESLDVSENQLTGPFPEWVCSSLFIVELILFDNQFTGSIPNCFGQLAATFSKLIIFNNFFSRTIPSSITNCSLVSTYRFDSNRFTGHIPLTFLHVNSSMENIDLASNMLSGPLDWLPTNTMPKFSTFDISKNQFTGSLPATLGNLIHLHSLLFPQNYITGPLNCQIVTTSITFLDGVLNQLTGTIPKCFEQISTWKYLYLQNNLLSGSLLESFNWTQLHKLQTLSLYSNFITGSIPDSLAKIDQLTNLLLQFNQLTGTVPSGFQSLTELSSLLLQGNQLHGRLETLMTRGSFRSITQMDLSNNGFTGSLPNDFFETATKLTDLAMAANCFEGSLPESVCAATSLERLCLDGLTTGYNCRNYIWQSDSSSAAESDNGGSTLFQSFVLQRTIAGSIPLCYFEMPRLQLLHLSGNALVGTIPTQVSMSSSLVNISLSHNRLTGTIPDSFLQWSWQSFDLSYNKFHGSLGALKGAGVSSDSAFNVSLDLLVNRLSGPVPNAIQSVESISILDGNMFSCSWDRKSLPRNDPVYSTYSCGSNATNSSVFIFVLCACMVPVVLWIWQRWKQRSDVATISPELQAGKSLSLHDDALAVPSGVRGFSITHSSPDDSAGHETGCVVQQLRCISRWVGHGVEYVRTSRLVTWMHALLFASLIAKWQFVQQYLQSPKRQDLQHRDDALVAVTAAVSTALSLYLDHFYFVVSFMVRTLVWTMAILLPMFALSKEYFFTYSHQYIWQVAATMMRGSDATILLCVVFGVTLVLCHRWWNVVLRRPILQARLSALLDQLVVSRVAMGVSAEKDHDPATIETTPVERSQSQSQPGSEVTWTVRMWTVWTLTFLMNVVVMLILDSGYVYLLLNYNGFVVVVAQIALAGVKVLWNDFSIYWVHYHLLTLLGADSHHSSEDVSLTMPCDGSC
jgi:Leucine-rich repeat (LRR) protein